MCSDSCRWHACHVIAMDEARPHLCREAEYDAGEPPDGEEGLDVDAELAQDGEGDAADEHPGDEAGGEGKGRVG